MLLQPAARRPLASIAGRPRGSKATITTSRRSAGNLSGVSACHTSLPARPSSSWRYGPKALSQSSPIRQPCTANPASWRSRTARTPRYGNTPTIGCRSLSATIGICCATQAARSTSLGRNSHASYISATTAPGGSRPISSSSSGRRLPLLVTIWASKATPRGGRVRISTRSSTPAMRASARVCRAKSPQLP